MEFNLSGAVHMPTRQVGLYQRQKTLRHAVFVVIPIGCEMCVHESDRGIAGGGVANRTAADVVLSILPHYGSACERRAF
jgi:hypothetical protein